jgi:hypothetical protein
MATIASHSSSASFALFGIGVMSLGRLRLTAADVMRRAEEQANSWLDRSVPGPLRKSQAGWNFIRRFWVRRQRLCRPSKVIFERRAQGVIVGKTRIVQRQRKARSRSFVHLLVFAVSRVQTNDKGLIGYGLGVVRGPTNRLGPVLGQTLNVEGVNAMRKRVANNGIRQAACVPSACQGQKPRESADRLVNRLTHLPSPSRRGVSPRAEAPYGETPQPRVE